MKKKDTPVYVIGTCPFCGYDFFVGDFLKISFKAMCLNPECGMVMRSYKGYGDLVDKINRRAKV